MSKGLQVELSFIFLKFIRKSKQVVYYRVRKLFRDRATCEHWKLILHIIQKLLYINNTLLYGFGDPWSIRSKIDYFHLDRIVVFRIESKWQNFNPGQLATMWGEPSGIPMCRAKYFTQRFKSSILKFRTSERIVVEPFEL